MASRALRADPDFSIIGTLKALDKDLLELVHQRLSGLLEAAQLSSNRLASSSHYGPAQDSSAQSAASKTLDAAKQIQLQTAEAARNLAMQQKQLLSRAQSMKAEDEPGEVSKGAGKTSKRQQKNQSWQDKQNSRMETQKSGKRRK